MTGLAALPAEVLASVLAQLPPCEAIQLQRVSPSFRRAAVAGEELDEEVVDQLLMVLHEGGQGGRAALAACAARRWLARHAAGTKVLSIHDDSLNDASEAYMTIPNYTSLVSCLPALVRVDLCLPRPLLPDDLGCLLEALAWLPHLEGLSLQQKNDGYFIPGADEAVTPCPDTSAFAKLRSLTWLSLSFDDEEPYTVDGVVGALVSLTGLAHLSLTLAASTVVPAALGQLKGLRSLEFYRLNFCEFEAGCLELPSLISLLFDFCQFADAWGLPGVAALQKLTRIEFIGARGPRFFEHQLVQLPRLQHIIFEGLEPCGACPWLFRLPADTGFLGSTLRRLGCSGVELAQFPPALAQLVALEHLYVRSEFGGFAGLPASITALSRLTELELGQGCGSATQRQHGFRSLDVRALGDLSGFPALRALFFWNCQVMMCPSVVGAAQHASLSCISFGGAHPAPECAPMVLQLGQALRQLGRAGVVYPW